MHVRLLQSKMVSSFRSEGTFFFFSSKRKAIPFETRLVTMLVSRDDRRESFVLPGERESRTNVEGELRP